MESTSAGMCLPELGKSGFRGESRQKNSRLVGLASYAQTAYPQRGRDEVYLGFHSPGHTFYPDDHSQDKIQNSLLLLVSCLTHLCDTFSPLKCSAVYPLIASS